MQFPSGSQGFLQPRGDIRESFIPRGFRALPDDIWEVVDAYFHRQELEDKVGRDTDDDQEMSTDTWTVPKYHSNSVYTSSYKRHRTVQYEGFL